MLLTVNFDSLNKKITINWLPDTNTYNFFVYKKLKTDSTFGNYIAKLNKNQLSFTDSLPENIEYEYKIEKDCDKYFAYGYASVASKLEEKHHRGKILILVDSTVKSPLFNEIVQLKFDLTADGWEVLEYSVPRAEEFDAGKVKFVKNFIKQIYDLNDGLRAIYLLGRVPVPYSGDFAVDGHDDHYGAWPTDGFYAEINGTWTDTITGSYDVAPRIKNKPDDGKFDQNVFPSALEIELGRVDLFNLPLFDKNEIELLRNYLKKTSDFKNNKFDIRRRAIITDNFGPDYKEAFASSGWTNFYSLVGGDSTIAKNARVELRDNDYLWFYGCGAGNYESAWDAAYTFEMADFPFRAAFTMIFGSYNGDWDSENNVLRAVLAAEPYGFTSAWAGRPHWFLHHTGMGETIGYSTRLTQNVYPAVYQSARSFARRMNHIALMGDPTLRLHYFEKPANMKTEILKEGIKISWEYNSNNVEGFNIYRAENFGGKFVKINNQRVKSSFFIDSTPQLGTNIYMVRAVRLENTPTGTYYNMSLGSFSDLCFYPKELNDGDIVIAPNPTDGKIKISAKLVDENIWKIELYNSFGQLINIYEKNINQLDDNFISEINLTDFESNSLPAGAYYMRLYITSKGVLNKLITISQ